LISSAVAALTYTASDSEVGIEADKIPTVIESDLSGEEFELAVAQSHSRWIWFNNKTNVINAPLITLTNILLVVSLFHLSLGAYIGLVGWQSWLVTSGVWVFLIAFILSSNILRQMNSLRKVVDLREWRPW